MINVYPFEEIVKKEFATCWNLLTVERVIFVYGRVLDDLLIPVSVGKMISSDEGNTATVDYSIGSLNERITEE